MREIPPVDTFNTNATGLLEKLYTARHSLGLYHAIIVLNSYHCTMTLSQQQQSALVSTALAKIIPRHAALCHGIHGEHSNTPSYVPVGRIDFTKHLSFRPSAADEVLLHQLEAIHDSPWVDQESTPPWQVIVYHDSESSTHSTSIQIAFVVHHGLADGISAAAFHSDLLKALQEVSTQRQLPPTTVNEVTIEKAPSWIAPVETLVNFSLSWGFLLGKVLEEYGPRFLFRKQTNYFTGEPCQLSDEFPYKTRIQLLTLESDTVKSLLTKCKSRKASITVLLSVILARALALAVPSAEAFLGSLPYALRIISGTDYDSMVNQVSALEVAYPSDVLPKLGKQPLAIEAFWLEVEKGSTQLQTHLSNCLVNNLVALLPYVSDHHEYYRKKLGHSRETTFDMSNIGVLKSSPGPGHSWTAERSIFTQGAAVVGAALNVNVASVLDGPMTITFSWQENILREETVSGTIKHFDSTLAALTQPAQVS